MSEDQIVVKPGQSVYSADGDELGVVQGITEHGFQVRLGEDARSLSLEHDPGHEVGEGYLVWRCSECGEVDDLDDGFPDECPNCGAAAEALYAWLED